MLAKLPSSSMTPKRTVGGLGSGCATPDLADTSSPHMFTFSRLRKSEIVVSALIPASVAHGSEEKGSGVGRLDRPA